MERHLLSGDPARCQSQVAPRGIRYYDVVIMQRSEIPPFITVNRTAWLLSGIKDNTIQVRPLLIKSPFAMPGER